MIYTVKNIELGDGDGEDIKKDIVYAKLVGSDGISSIDGTLEYILKAIRDRDLQVDNVTVIKKMERGVFCSTVTLDTV